MATFTKFQPFTENLAEKKFNLGSDTLKVALTNTAPTNTFATLSQVTEISYTNCSDRTSTSFTTKRVPSDAGMPARTRPAPPSASPSTSIRSANGRN